MDDKNTYVDDIIASAETLRPTVEKVTKALLEQHPDIDADTAAASVAQNIWWEIERRLREEFERRTHEQGLAFADVVSGMVTSAWATL